MTRELGVHKLVCVMLKLVGFVTNIVGLFGASAFVVPGRRSWARVYSNCALKTVGIQSSRTRKACP